MERRTFIKFVVDGIAVALALPIRSIPIPEVPLPVNFTPEDLKKATLLSPGWYKATVNNITERESKRDGSKLIAIELVTVNEQIPITTMCSEKFVAPVISFLDKCGLDIHEAQGIDLDYCIGKTIEVKVDNTKYLDKMFNTVNLIVNKSAT